MPLREHIWRFNQMRRGQTLREADIGARHTLIMRISFLLTSQLPLSPSGWKLCRTFFSTPPQGRPLHPILLHTASEPSAGLQWEDSISQLGYQRHLQPGRVHTEWADANTAVPAGWVRTTLTCELFYRQRHLLMAFIKQIVLLNIVILSRWKSLLHFSMMTIER